MDDGFLAFILLFLAGLVLMLVMDHVGRRID